MFLFQCQNWAALKIHVLSAGREVNADSEKISGREADGGVAGDTGKAAGSGRVQAAGDRDFVSEDR